MTRICKNCGTHLSRYNNDELCFPCQKKKEELARISPYMIRNTRLNPIARVNVSLNVVQRMKGL